MNEEYTVFFDDVDIRSLGFLFQPGHSNPLLAGTRDRDTTIPGRNGSLDFGADLEPILFNLPLYIDTNNPYDLQHMVRNVKAILLDANGKPRTFKLKFGYEPDKYYNVRVTGSIPIERIIARSGRFNLPLICHEGYALSVAKNDEVLWGSEELTFNSTSYTFGHTGSGVAEFLAPGSTSVEVVGNNVRPMLIVSGFGTDVTIGWGGKTMTLGTFTESNWAIDLKEYVVTKDGINALNSIGGDWLTMVLAPGTNEINVDGSGLNLEIAFVYRDIWYG